MSKFNTTNTIKTTNRSGNVAYSMSDREHLVTSVLTTFVNEDKSYGSTDEDILNLATRCAKTDPEFLAKLTAYARNEANLRSVSHLLLAIIARHAPSHISQAVRNTIVRADDILETLACFKSLYSETIPNGLKRAIGKVMETFSAYDFAKYNGGNKSFKFRDVLRIAHPKPSSESVQKIFSDIIHDSLPTPNTWETKLSARGNTKEVWEELINNNELGYMAMLRNLRNMIRADVDLSKVLEKIGNPEAVRKSRQLPFRFYSAYLQLKNANLITKEIAEALERAMHTSVDSIETLPGRTLIAVDISGSMGCRLSYKSEITCENIAILLGVLSAHICESSTVCYFDDNYRIRKYDKYDDILVSVAQAPHDGCCTDMSLPFQYALQHDTSSKPFDRVIVLSDHECNCCSKRIQSYADMYRRQYNPNLWVHAIDLQGYGTQQFCGEKFNLMAGWNETQLKFISLAEKGISSLVDYISNFPMK